MDCNSMTEEEATCILNALLPPPIPPEPKKLDPKYSQFDDAENFLERVGLRVEDLDRLNIIHVTGTKGKGSTCAFTEKILRSHGFRTGFFSSPHLLVFRDRIRINGEPIGEELFTKHFWQVYSRLEETKVDVVILEVGIGGQYDCTNIIRKPWVCGIVSLGIDHTEILGDTIEKIAWHKGGIFKPGVPAFTVKQPEGAMAVLRDRAKEIGCPLWVCPDLQDYPVDCGPYHLGLAGKHQRSNASLALQLSHTWLLRKKSPTDESLTSTSVDNGDLPEATSFKLSPIMVKGLAETHWSGRAEILKHGPVTYYLDGAHTMRSIRACVDWFKQVSAQHEINASGRVVRVLLFNTSGVRNSAALMKPLVQCDFDFAVFCPNLIEATNYSNADQQGLNVSNEEVSRCLDNERSWCRYNNLGDNGATQLHAEDSLPLDPGKKRDTLFLPSIISALQWITQGRDSVVADPAIPLLPVDPSITAKAAPLRDAAEIQVLVTGSLYLVGGALKIFNLPPNKWNL